MEGSAIPPPSSPGPMIGESTKLRNALDLLNITKIIALIVGIIGFLMAAWTGFDMAVFGDILGLPWVGYYVVTGIVNLIIYTKIPEYENLVRSRRYGEAKEDSMLWAVLGVVFGAITGILLLLVIFMYLEELERTPYSPPQY